MTNIRSKIRLGVTLVALALLGPLATGAQVRVDGEYGLWVKDAGGELGVGWITSVAEEGVLEVIADGNLLFRSETPLGQAHFASLPRPTAESVLLRYGDAAGENLHSTEIYLREEGPRPSPILSEIDSLYVVGDVHGEYDTLLGLLANAGLVDAEGNWLGGGSHVVFLGDLFDRGADVTRTLWFLYELERQARAGGGGAHVVLGNHETMIFTSDVRYVSAKEQLIADLHATSYPQLFDIRESVLGQWLVDRPGVMKVNEVLLAHGGVAPGSSPRTVESVNDSLRTYMSEDLFYLWADTTVALVTDSAIVERIEDQYSRVIVMDSLAFARRLGMLFDAGGILWFRGYVESDGLSAELDDVLEEFGTDIHVVAHTPVPSIEARYDGRLLAVDLARAATEMLLLQWDPGGGPYRRYRVSLDGPPEPF